MKKLVLIDGHALLFRAFYAFPQTLTMDSGELINAVYGFTSILLTVIRELEPTHLVVSFDLDKPTFRHKSFKDYKAHREETPQELIDQEGRVRQVVEVLNIPVYEKEEFEADDVIGTLAEQAKDEEDLETLIVTGDLDALQLVDDDEKGKVHVYVPSRGKKPAKIYDEEAVEERYDGLEPEQVPDLKGLAGDVSDNIPGVKGIGPKTAIGLLKKYRTVEGVYKKIDEVLRQSGISLNSRSAQDDKVVLKSLATLSNKIGISGSVLRKLIDGRELAVMSKELAIIRRDSPIKLNVEKSKISDYDKAKAIRLFEELQFNSLIKKLPNDDFEESVQDALF